MLCFPHLAQELSKKQGSHSLLLSLSFIRWERAPAPQLVPTALVFQPRQGLLCPSPVFPQECGDREPLTGILQWLGEAGAGGMLYWEKGVYCQPVFLPQLPNTLLERNFFPLLTENATNKRSGCEI